ncbi:hypothetical protein [Streptomyces gobiensis]|uniref:Rv1733c family protein n=1 Tax=Streptomyces gobiensis TaxID=2875706 RepID=UPI001E3C6B99|nr:hypothetical protein [Streptomyces gobiensis]UGY94725.1 hypothetical protein test1122_25320 [Streptomyces gobiensis]
MFRAIAGLWRWRRNPLCRRSDRAESWLALTAALAIAVGAPLTGAAGGDAAHRALLRTVRDQHEHRHQVWATVQRTLPRWSADPEADWEHTARYRVIASWTAVDGTSHTAPVGTQRAARPGDRFRLWTDARGRIVARPMEARTAASHAALAGLVAAMAAAAATEAGRRLALRQLLRRRYERWEREWARVGPDWGRTDASS